MLLLFLCFFYSKILELVKTFSNISFVIYLPNELNFLFFFLSLESSLTFFKEKKKRNISIIFIINEFLTIFIFIFIKL